MEKTMLKLLKNNLPEYLEIVNIKECSNKYIITFKYQNEYAKSELKKSCMLGHEEYTVLSTIVTVLSTIYINIGDIEKAKLWLNKLVEK